MHAADNLQDAKCERFDRNAHGVCRRRHLEPKRWPRRVPSARVKEIRNRYIDIARKMHTLVQTYGVHARATLRPRTLRNPPKTIQPIHEILAITCSPTSSDSSYRARSSVKMMRAMRSEIEGMHLTDEHCAALPFRWLEPRSRVIRSEVRVRL